jgi:putative SOS response-associated peptidase YedK
MCGRYSLAPGELSQIRLEFQVEAQFEYAPRFNIAPTWAGGYEPPIIYQEPAGPWQLGLARWWMIPSSWQRPLSALPTAFNARAEELAQKPFWSRSFDSRRCLVPATGWREFRGPSGQRQAFQFHFDHALIAFAGIWDTWASPEGDTVRSFAIVTVVANDMVAPIHDRMPLCVDPPLYAAWLDPASSGASALAQLRKAADRPLSFYESDPRGNSSRSEGPECIAPRVIRQLGLFTR